MGLPQSLQSAVESTAPVPALRLRSWLHPSHPPSLHPAPPCIPPCRPLPSSLRPNRPSQRQQHHQPNSTPTPTSQPIDPVPILQISSHRLRVLACNPHQSRSHPSRGQANFPNQPVYARRHRRYHAVLKHPHPEMRDELNPRHMQSAVQQLRIAGQKHIDSRRRRTRQMDCIRGLKAHD